MADNSEKRARHMYLMTIVQTVCTLFMAIIAAGTLIGRFLSHH